MALDAYLSGDPPTASFASEGDSVWEELQAYLLEHGGKLQLATDAPHTQLKKLWENYSVCGYELVACPVPDGAKGVKHVKMARCKSPVRTAFTTSPQNWTNPIEIVVTPDSKCDENAITVTNSPCCKAKGRVIVVTQ